MSRSRYQKNNKQNILRWGYIIFFGLISTWLVASIIMQKSPSEVISGAFSKIPNPTGSAKDALIKEKDSIISDLETKLANCTGANGFKRGLVIIDSETLNMRDKPSLSSSIVLRIPANAEVKIMFYDTETYYLNGNAGRWCKINYAGTEGWVWGNFISEI